MIGKRLQELRKSKNMTQSDLAELLGLTKVSISSYENNKTEPPDAIKIKIAKLFHVSADYLIGLTNIPTAYDDETDYIRTSTRLSEEAKYYLQDYAEFLIFKFNR